MCCIFTCCGWLIDLFQRAWVFAMSFCMSGAICCVLTLGSMSGVALGYNYSLAEYMDLKETNVSVYLKRGVFDDEGLGDDMNFRRSGEDEGPEEMPNQMRKFGGGNQDDDSSAFRASGRRLDDSLLQSNQNHGFEGGLMKLTMAPPFAITTTTPIPTKDARVDNIIMKHAPGSLNQLKEIQTLINYRKALAAREPGKPGDHILLAGLPSNLISEQNYLPPHIFNAQPTPGRRAWQAPSTDADPMAWPNYVPGKIHPALMAVPPAMLREQKYWEAFKKSSPVFLDEYVTVATSPRAIRLNTLGQDMFPTEAPTFPVFTEEKVLPSPQQTPEFMNIGVDSGGGQMEQKMILDKYAPYLSSTKQYAREGGKEDTPKSDNEYYDDDIKGLPVRRKRHVHGIKRKAKGQNAPRSEQGKPDREHSDKVNHNNVIVNTDPTVLVSKPVSKDKVNAKASDLKSKLEKTPLYDQFINNKVNETESRILMRGLLGKTSRGLNKINNKLNDASSAEPNFINQRRFVFSFSTVFAK